MDGNSYIEDRERKIADIIREYSKGDVNRDWLINKNRDMDNVFKKSFNAIRDYTGDFDLALWYLAFSQSFGKRFEVMLRKMAELCTNSDKDIITFKKDVPAECPYRGSRDETIEEIFKIDFNKSTEEIRSEIKKIYRSENFFHSDKRCNLEAFHSCEHRNECPIGEWIEIFNEFEIPYRNTPKVFFYYDTLCLLNNKRISNFSELFLAVDSFTKEYLFSWDNVPGNDSERLLKFLRDDFHIDWAEDADISKSNDGKIHISKDNNSVEIIIDEEKAALKISDGRTHDLKVKKENGKLNILYTKDKTKKAVIIRTILKQIRGISTKVLLFLQTENLYNKRNLDYAELIFKDSHAIRVAERMDFPFYENDLVKAIRKFGERYNLTARQIDFALWEMGFVCTAEGCLHGVEGKKCIFYDVCSWDGKR
jgi:hypothetical protein